MAITQHPGRQQIFSRTKTLGDYLHPRMSMFGYPWQFIADVLFPVWAVLHTLYGIGKMLLSAITFNGARFTDGANNVGRGIALALATPAVWTIGLFWRSSRTMLTYITGNVVSKEKVFEAVKKVTKKPYKLG